METTLQWMDGHSLHHGFLQAPLVPDLFLPLGQGAVLLPGQGATSASPSARPDPVLEVAGSIGQGWLPLGLRGAHRMERDERWKVTGGSFRAASSSAVPVVPRNVSLMQEDSYQMLGHSESGMLR